MVDSAKTRRKMMVLFLQLSEKKWGLSPIWQKCSTIHLQQRTFIGGLTVACPHLFEWQKSQKNRPTKKGFLHFTITRNFLILPRIFLFLRTKTQTVNYDRYMPMRKNQQILGKIKKFSVMKTRRKPLEKGVVSSWET